MGARSRPPRRSRLIWVEGKDDSAVIQSLCEKHHVPEVFTVRSKDGVDELLRMFYTELRAPGVDHFGVVVDANGNAQARWDSIRHTLEAEGYPDVPERPAPDGIILPATEHRPVFGAWIMPDNASPGALEDFAAALVPVDDWLWSRAGEAVDALPAEHRRFSDLRRSKAYIHTWLAWQEYPGSPMGQAIGKGDLDAHAPAAGRFIGWLRRLMLDDPAAENE